MKRRTLNGKINDNHVLWVIREYVESKTRKSAPEKQKKQKKLPKKDSVPTWVDLNAILQKQVTQISEYVEGNSQKAVSQMDKVKHGDPNEEHCDTSCSAVGEYSR